MIAHIAAHQRHRFSYVRVSVDGLDMQSMGKMVYDTWSVAMDQVDMIHWSHPCETYLEAHHNNNFHRNGLQPPTDKARTHDGMLAQMAALLKHISVARVPRFPWVGQDFRGSLGTNGTDCRTGVSTWLAYVIGSTLLCQYFG